jgi:SAM-dependent methyltransferase
MMRDFYQDNYLDYHLRTFNIDPSSFLNPLVSRIHPGALILDVGCGSGRDLVWLSKRGFRVIGLDRSSRLAALAKVNSSAPVIVADFEMFDFSRFSADAVILVGALVHIPPERFGAVLQNVSAAVKNGGYVLLTLKEGKGSGKDHQGREFFYWEDEHLSEYFAECGMRRVEIFKQVSLVNQKDIWLTYLLVKNA